MRNELLIDLEQHDDEAKRGSDKVDANSPTEEPLEAAPAIADRELLTVLEHGNSVVYSIGTIERIEAARPFVVSRLKTLVVVVYYLLIISAESLIRKQVWQGKKSFQNRIIIGQNI